MSVTTINPPALPDPTPNGYSTAAVAPPAGRLAFVSGQGGFERDGTLSPDFAAQVEAAYRNLLAALAGIDAGPGDVLKLTTFVVDHDPSRLPALTAAVTTAFGDAPPAQTLVPVPCLALPPMLFEVEAVVWLS